MRVSMRMGMSMTVIMIMRVSMMIVSMRMTVIMIVSMIMIVRVRVAKGVERLLFHGREVAPAERGSCWHHRDRMSHRKRQHVALHIQHPKRQHDDEDSHDKREIHFQLSRNQPCRSHRGQHANKNNAARMRQRNKDAEDHRIDRFAASAHQVGCSDRLTMPWCCGVHCACPEA